jgi:hypothetical protein
MPYIKYIDIDSSFRNRVQFPIPAHFAVSMGCPSNNQSPVSSQTPVYPLPIPVGSSALEVQPIAFVQPSGDTNTADEWRYLPYFYCVDTFSNCTRFRLDPIVLQSVTLEDLDAVQASNDYPFETIPLDRANNTYIGRVLESVRDSGSEFRTIISSSYSDEEIILQTFDVTECYVNDNGDTELKVIISVLTEQVPSDIYRFYVGKYLRISGTNYLVIDSKVSSIEPDGLRQSRQVTITIRSGLESKPTLPITVSVVATESWFVEVDRPFTDDPPSYPAYYNVFVNPDPYVFGDTNFNNPYETHDIIVHGDGTTIGMVVQVSDRLLYYTSVDSTGVEFNDSIVIDSISNFTTATSFTSGRLTGISLSLIDGNPAVAVTANAVNVSGDVVRLYYIQASATDGSTWNVIEEQSFIGTGTVHLVSNPDALFGEVVGMPVIVYTNQSNDIVYTISDSHSGGTWTVFDTGLNGEVLSAEVIYFGNQVANSYYDGIGILYNEVGGELRFTQYHPSASYTTVVSTSTANEGLIVPIIADLSPPGFTNEPMPYLLYRQGTDLYGQAYAPLDDAGPIYTIPTTTPILLLSDVTSFDAVQVSSTALVTDTGRFVNAVVYITTLSGQEIIPHRTQLSNMTIESERSTITTRDETRDIKTLFPITSSLFPYITASSDFFVSSYSPAPITSIAPDVANYRIRDGTPITSSSNDITAVSSTVLTLPSVQSVSECDYIWIYNTPVATTPSAANFHMYNDIRKVVSVNRISNSITINSPLSADINIFGSNNGGDNDYMWEIWSNVTDSYNPLEFYGETAQVAQRMCYYIRLINITLPNITLSVGNGNVIAFYPYVYVQFESVTTPHHNVIISNNPNSRRCLFKVPITNLVSPDRSTYVNLSGGNMEHIITFTPMDTFLFSVILPTGEVFQTLKQDRPSPFNVDSTLQVSATFQVRLATDYYEEQ